MRKRRQEEKQRVNLLNVLPAQNLLRGIERHGETSDDQVRKSETNEKVVVDSPQFSVEHDTEDYKEIREYGNDDDEDEDNSFESMEHAEIIFFIIYSIKCFVFP